MPLLRTFLALGLGASAPLAGLAQAPSGTSPASSLPRPLVLEAALAFSVEQNPALRRTREQVAESEGVLIETRARQLPTVSLSGHYTRLDEGLVESAGSVSLSDDQSWAIDLQVTQVVYAGGSVRASKRAQSERVEAARLAVRAALEDTLLEVRERFYAVLLAREIIGVREQALGVLEGELTRARNERDAGAGSDFDVLRAEVAVANAKPPLIRARNELRTAQVALRATLGASADPTGEDADLAVQGDLFVAAWRPTLIEAVTSARRQRVELRAQETLVRAAEADVDAARSGNKPTVSVFGGYGVQKSQFSSDLGDTVHGWSTGVQTSWNIFDGRATAGRVHQARSRVAQAKLTGEELFLAIDVEVRQTHSNLLEAEELLIASEKVVEQAHESLRLAQARFDAGASTQLDVLTAQSALTEASFNEAQARHDYAIAVARLRRATGARTG